MPSFRTAIYVKWDGRRVVYRADLSIFYESQQVVCRLLYRGLSVEQRIAVRQVVPSSWRWKLLIASVS